MFCFFFTRHCHFQWLQRRGGSHIREASRCPKPSCFFGLISNRGSFHFNFLYWFIACHMNRAGAGLCRADLEQSLYSGMAPLVQRKVISSGPARKEKLLTMSLWPPSLSPSHCLAVFPSPSFSFFSRTGSEVYDVKLFPEDPVKLIVGETLTLNCTVSVEFNTGVDIQWSYPGKLVRSSNALVTGCTIPPYAKQKLRLFLLPRPTAWWKRNLIVKLCLTPQ